MPGKKSFLDEAILDGPEDTAGRPHGPLPLELLAELSRDILPLVGHCGHCRREARDCLVIGERRRKRKGRKTMRRSVTVRVPHSDAIAVFCGRTREESTQLAATEDAEHGSRFDHCRYHDRR